MIKVSAHHLANALTMLAPVTAGAKFEVLGGILFSTKSGLLSLTASNLSIAVTIYVECDANSRDEFVAVNVPAMLAIAKAGGESILSLDYINPGVYISGSGSRSKIKTIAACDFPLVASPVVKDSVVLTPKQVEHLGMASMTADRNTRTIRISASGGSARSDGYNGFHAVKSIAQVESDCQVDITIPLNSWQIIERIAKTSERVEISSVDDALIAWFHSDQFVNATAIAKRAALPLQPSGKLEESDGAIWSADVPAHDLQRAFNAVSLFASDDITWITDGATLISLAANSEVGSASATLLVDISGQPFENTVSASMMRRFFNSLDDNSEFVEIRMFADRIMLLTPGLTYGVATKSK